MNIEIRQLTPNLVEDYVRFFDTSPHADNKENISVTVCGGAMMTMKVRISHHR